MSTDRLHLPRDHTPQRHGRLRHAIEQPAKRRIARDVTLGTVTGLAVCLVFLWFSSCLSSSPSRIEPINGPVERVPQP